MARLSQGTKRAGPAAGVSPRLAAELAASRKGAGGSRLEQHSGLRVGYTLAPHGQLTGHVLSQPPSARVMFPHLLLF